MAASFRRAGAEFLRLALALVLALCAITALALTLESAGVSEAARAARKALVPAFILVYVVLLRVRARELAAAFGMIPANGAARRVAAGLAAGAGTLLLLNLVLIAAGARRFGPEVPPPRLAGLVPLYLAQALVLGFLEEGLFRGLVFGRLRKSAGAAPAVLAGSLLFAAAHFLRPPRDAGGDALSVASDCLEGVARAFADTDRLKEVFGLFLVGAVLSVIRLRSGTIWLALGVHAGWVWVRLVADKGLEEVKPVVREHLLLVGTMRHYDGIAGWLALLLTLTAVLFLGGMTAGAPACRGGPARAS